MQKEILSEFHLSEVESSKNTATFKPPPREFPMNSATMKTDYSFPLASKSPTKLSIPSQ